MSQQNLHLLLFARNAVTEIAEETMTIEDIKAHNNK